MSFLISRLFTSAFLSGSITDNKTLSKHGREPMIKNVVSCRFKSVKLHASWTNSRWGIIGVANAMCPYTKMAWTPNVKSCVGTCFNPRRADPDSLISYDHQCIIFEQSVSMWTIRFCLISLVTITMILWWNWFPACFIFVPERSWNFAVLMTHH